MKMSQATRAAAAAIPNEMLRLRCLSLLTLDVDYSINERARIAALLEANVLPDGSVWVQLWERDCDGAEATDSYRIHASLQAYYYEYQRIAERAEGPFSLTITNKEGRRATRGQGWGIN
jgi:hypothetical protein